jgi:glutamate synthase (NADPH) small chain
MNTVKDKRIVSDTLIRLKIETPIASRDILSGQYINLRLHSDGCDIPVTATKPSPDDGTLCVSVSLTDSATEGLSQLQAGDTIYSISGPFGKPAEINNYNSVLCISDEDGLIPMLPIIKSLRQAGNKIITVLSGSKRKEMVMESEARSYSDEVIVIEEDDNKSNSHLSARSLEKLFKNSAVRQVFTVGTTGTIREPLLLSREFNIPVQAILYSKPPRPGGLQGVFNLSFNRADKSCCMVDGINFNACYTDFGSMFKRFGSTTP